MSYALSEMQWRVREWFPTLGEEKLEKLRIYHVELLRWTQSINLISPNSVLEADRIHFADSILGSQIILKDVGAESEVWDIGSGNGMPGVVLNIIAPERHVLCVDADERKVAFIKQIAIKLNLPLLGARKERIEKIPSESIGVAVARGFAPLAKALLMTKDQFTSGGRFYHFKGLEWARETKEVPKELSSTWNTDFLGSYELPHEGVGPSRAKNETRVILRSNKK